MQSDALIAFNFVNEANDSLEWLYVLYGGRVDAKDKNPDQSYQWPATLGYSKQRLAEKASVMHGWLSM